MDLFFVEWLSLRCCFFLQLWWWFLLPLMLELILGLIFSFFLVFFLSYFSLRTPYISRLREAYGGDCSAVKAELKDVRAIQATDSAFAALRAWTKHRKKEIECQWMVLVQKINYLWGPLSFCQKGFLYSPFTMGHHKGTLEPDGLLRF